MGDFPPFQALRVAPRVGNRCTNVDVYDTKHSSRRVAARVVGYGVCVLSCSC